MNGGIEIDWGDLERYFKSLKNKNKKGFNAAVRIGAEYICNELRLNTPIATGRARSSWRVGGISSGGSCYEVTIYNSTPYLKWVEEGHGQEVGRYVPAIGKRLVRKYTKGRWFIKRTMNKMPTRKLRMLIAEAVANNLK